MTITHTDELLAEWQDGVSAGHARAAGYLMEVPPEVRDALVTEGTIFANMTPGHRWADGIFYAVNQYARTGVVPDTYTRENAAIIKREQTEPDANGNRQTFYPKDV